MFNPWTPERAAIVAAAEIKMDTAAASVAGFLKPLGASMVPDVRLVGELVKSSARCRKSGRGCNLSNQ